MNRRMERGFTLLEMMISSMLILMLMAAATVVVLAGMNLSHRQDVLHDAEERSIVAEHTLSAAIRSAGFGVPNGVYVGEGSTAVLINPVHGSDNAGTNSTDDIWVVAPDQSATTEDCTANAGAARVSSVASGIDFGCTTGFATGDDVVIYDVATNKGALLSNITKSGTKISAYTESGISNYGPNMAGLAVGQVVYKVKLLHFYVATNPKSGNLALYEETVKPATATGGEPFVSKSTPIVHLVQDDVEDLQLVYEFENAAFAGDPTHYNLTNSLAAAYTANTLRSVEIALVSQTNPIYDSRGKLLPETAISVGNHTVTSPPKDGRKRIEVNTRVEIPNLALAYQ